MVCFFQAAFLGGVRPSLPSADFPAFLKGPAFEFLGETALGNDDRTPPTIAETGYQCYSPRHLRVSYGNMRRWESERFLYV